MMPTPKNVCMTGACKPPATCSQPWPVRRANRALLHAASTQALTQSQTLVPCRLHPWQSCNNQAIIPKSLVIDDSHDPAADQRPRCSKVEPAVPGAALSWRDQLRPQRGLRGVAALRHQLLPVIVHRTWLAIALPRPRAFAGRGTVLRCTLDTLQQASTAPLPAALALAQAPHAHGDGQPELLARSVGTRRAHTSSACHPPGPCFLCCCPPSDFRTPRLTAGTRCRKPGPRPPQQPDLRRAAGPLVQPSRAQKPPFSHPLPLPGAQVR